MTMLQYHPRPLRRSYWQPAAVLLALALLWPVSAKAQATADDLAAVFSAWGVHQAGFSMSFNTGPRGFMRLFCMWWCLPYVETPADYKTWNWGRTKYWPDDLNQTARLPGQPADCRLSGFARANNVIYGRCVIPGGNSMFQPSIAPGKWRVYLEGLTPPPAARIVLP